MSLTQNYETYLGLDLSSYLGQWIAIFEKKVIAYGENPKAVYAKAMEISKNKRVMLTKVKPSNIVEIL
jgi:hypothetical protein